MNLPIHHSSFTTHNLFILFVQRMAAATSAELFELKPIRRVLFVLGRDVVTLLALSALQNNVISRHNTSCSECAIYRVSFSEYAINRAL